MLDKLQRMVKVGDVVTFLAGTPDDMISSELAEGVSEYLASSLEGEESDNSHIQGSEERFRRHLRQAGFSSLHFFFFRRPMMSLEYGLLRQR